MTDQVTAVGVAAAAACLALWFVLYGAVLFVTRVRPVEAPTPTQDFGGDQPPAVVSLLANDWRITEDAVESTVIDLAARRLLEFRQPGNDPAATTVHVSSASVQGLLPFELRVMTRVRALAVGGVVPLTALTFRDAGEAQAWNAGFAGEVLDHSRSLGLSRGRVSGAGTSLLTGAAAVTAAGVGLAVLPGADDMGTAFGAAVVAFAVLVGIARRDRGERDTPAGRAVARRWLGLARYLRGDEAFAVLPPAAVAVWDRYLSYGAAVGATRVCAAVLDLGMGNRKRVWSSHGGTWHRVRVRYPRFWGHYGRPAWRTALLALIPLVFGWFVVTRLAFGTADRVEVVITAIGVLLLGFGAYRLLRTALDLLTPRRITGQVLWQELWRSTQPRGDDHPSVPWLDYLVVDDGSGDRLTAWGRPCELTPYPAVGDTVTLTVRPWSRRITALQIAPSPAPSPSPDPQVKTSERDTPAFPFTPLPLPGGVGVGGPLVELAVAASVSAVAVEAALRVDELLTEPEIGAATGTQAVLDGAGGRMVLGGLEMATYVGTDGQGRVLVVTLVRGAAADLVLRAAQGGEAVSRIGDEAWRGPRWALTRVGDTTVRLSLEHAATGEGLIDLLAKAARRLVTHG